MKCPGCGYESFDLLETCKRCGAPMVATAGAPGGQPVGPADDLSGLRFEPERSAAGQRLYGRRRRRLTREDRVDHGGDFVEMLDDDAIEVEEDDLDGALAALPVFAAADTGPPFLIDDDLFAGHDSGGPGVSSPATACADADDRRWRFPPEDAELPGPAFVFSEEEPGTEAGAEPIIDRYDEVPERHWAPEVAGLGRRVLALLVDQALLLAALGIFFLGAFMALRLNGVDTGLLLAPAGFQASASPFALLAALLSLGYFCFFHSLTGRTPGKALAGIEVRTGEGGALTWGRAILRWSGAVLGLACAGVGIFWPIFESRRRGWADLISGTIIVHPRRDPPADVSRR